MRTGHLYNFADGYTFYTVGKLSQRELRKLTAEHGNLIKTREY